MHKLTPKQAQFVQEYLVDLNATQAALRAGYSEKTAKQQGARLLTKVDVQAALQEAMAAREERTEITQDRVIAELAKVAFGDRRKLMTWGPKGVELKDSGTLSDDAAAMVSEVSETETQFGGTIKLKTHDKVKALELLGRHLGIFDDSLKLTGPRGGPIEVTPVLFYLPDNGRK